MADLETKPLLSAESKGKIMAIAIAIIAYLIFLFLAVALELELPFWSYGLATAFLLVVIILLGFSNKIVTEGQVSSRNYLSWIRPNCIATMIAIAIIIVWVYPAANETPIKTYYSDELAEMASGDCMDDDGVFICDGAWSLSIPDNEDGSYIRNIKLFPADGYRSLSEGLTVMSGPYDITFWKEQIDCSGSKTTNNRYKASIKYNGNWVYLCADVAESSSQTKQIQEPISVGRPGWWISGLGVRIGDNFIAIREREREGERIVPFGKDITIFSKRGAELYKIEVR